MKIVSIIQDSGGLRGGYSLCMLGNQALLFELDEFISVVKLYGINFDEKKCRDMKAFDAATMFELIGIDDVHVIDVSDYEGADTIYDLADDLPDELVEKFDYIVDGGTLEHIFDISQAMFNVSSMLKKGGMIFHFSVIAGDIDHAFYSISPTFYEDYYSDNNFAIKQIEYAIEIDNNRDNRYSDYYKRGRKPGNWLYVFTQDCRLMRNIFYHKVNEYIDAIRSASYTRGEALVFVCVKKVEDFQYRVPMQRLYKELWRTTSKRSIYDEKKIVDIVKKNSQKNWPFLAKGYFAMKL